MFPPIPRIMHHAMAEDQRNLPGLQVGLQFVPLKAILDKLFIHRYQLVPQPSSHPPGPGPPHPNSDRPQSTPEPNRSQNARSASRPQDSPSPPSSSNFASSNTSANEDNSHTGSDSRRTSGSGGGSSLFNLLGHILHGGDRNGDRRGNAASSSSQPPRPSNDFSEHSFFVPSMAFVPRL